MKQNYYTGIFKNDDSIKAVELTKYIGNSQTVYLKCADTAGFPNKNYFLYLSYVDIYCKKSDFKQLTNHVWNGRKYKKIDETQRPFKLKYKLEIDTYHADKAHYGLKTMLSELRPPPYIRGVK